MKVIRKYSFLPSTTPNRNDVLKIQIVDNRYGACEIYGYFDRDRNEFYYTSMCGECLCREYIDTFAMVSWEYNN